MIRLFLISLIVIGSNLQTVAQQLVCGTSEKMQAQLGSDQNLSHLRSEIEEFTQRWIEEHGDKNGRAVITIPVVVHVVYNTAQQNISDAQIHSQIDVLNQDYRRTNPDVAGVPSVWTSLVADCEIEFALANNDPNDEFTSGITRTETSVTNWLGSDNVKYTSEGGKDAWPNTNYLNIWVCNIGAGLLGYAYQPGINPALDGIVVGYRYFGTVGTLSPTYNLGRTSTHEIGHYFNLDHLWGPGNDNLNCTQDDGVGDTPKQMDPNFDCTISYPHETCGNGPDSDMFNNFMDYGDDECVFFFTNGQKARMLAALNGPRSPLLTSDGLSHPNAISKPEFSSTLEVYPNPTNGPLHVRFNSESPISATIDLLDISGRLVQRFSNHAISQHDFSLDLSGLNTGIYLLQVNTDKGTVTKRINLIK